MSSLSKHGAVFFDVDGVLVDSVGAKGEAFADAFVEFPEHRADIIELHVANGGVPRGRKFEMIHEQILGVPLTPERAEELRARFASDVVRRVAAAPEIAGAAEAVQALHCRRPLHAISAVPQGELEQTLGDRGLLAYFRSAHGVPPSKTETVAQLLATHAYAPAECVFVGDSVHDFVAARDNGVKFIHVRSPSSNPFEGAVETVTDLRGLDSVVEYVLREPGA